eukprot:SAG31_NODE_5253_length_2647_cov_2.193485_2_plen_211_part_00
MGQPACRGRSASKYLKISRQYLDNISYDADSPAGGARHWHWHWHSAPRRKGAHVDNLGEVGVGALRLRIGAAQQAQQRGSAKHRRRLGRCQGWIGLDVARVEPGRSLGAADEPDSRTSTRGGPRRNRGAGRPAMSVLLIRGTPPSGGGRHCMRAGSGRAGRGICEQYIAIACRSFRYLGTCLDPSRAPRASDRFQCASAVVHKRTPLSKF